MLDIQTGVDMDSEAVLYDPATVALLEGLNEACQVAMDRAAYVQGYRFRSPDAKEEVEGEGEKVKEDIDPRAAAFISVVGPVAIQTIVGETVLSIKSLSIDLTRIESEYPHKGLPLPVVQNGM